MKKVAVLGATGMVGQRFVQLLMGHPFFKLVDLCASERSAGKRYKEATRWMLDAEMPEKVADLEVKRIDPNLIDADIVFSALPKEVAKNVEPKFAEAGFIVSSNASAFRMVEDIPLLIPEVNPEHLELIEVQRENRGWDGAIITNPNCTTIMAMLPLKPIYDNFGLRRVIVTSMQALSGAGYSGVVSMAILDNLIPFIRGEEEKVETEGLKIFGKFEDNKITKAGFKISASCNRVNVLDGHTESIFVEVEEDCSVDDVKEVLRKFRGLPQKLKLPTAPQNPIIVREEEDRPQPRLDRLQQGGMSVSVGRIREDPVFDFKFTSMGHNTIRGAAGASILNAELLLKKNKA
jgi:aspartate-semialdehyde dehydrogenase